MRTLSIPDRRRRAATLPELLVAIAIVALVSGFVLPALGNGFDRIETRGAAQATLQAFFAARANAIAQGRRTSVVIDRSRARVLVVAGADTLMVRAIGSEHGVTLTASRDSMTFFADGLGLGGANLSVVLSRGRAADTVLVSREGRAKLGTRAR